MNRGKHLVLKLALLIFLVVLASAMMAKIHGMGSIMKMKNQ
jgi:hypothetical protein